MARKIKKILKKNSLKSKTTEKIKIFRKEFRKSLTTGIIAAFGFLIALVWKDVITEFVNNITNKSPLQGKLISAIIVTGICVLGILIISKMNPKEK
jgi:hypothetical protein